MASSCQLHPSLFLVITLTDMSSILLVQWLQCRRLCSYVPALVSSPRPAAHEVASLQMLLVSEVCGYHAERAMVLNPGVDMSPDLAAWPQDQRSIKSITELSCLFQSQVVPVMQGEEGIPLHSISGDIRHVTGNLKPQCVLKYSPMLVLAVVSALPPHQASLPWLPSQQALARGSASIQSSRLTICTAVP